MTTGFLIFLSIILNYAPAILAQVENGGVADPATNAFWSLLRIIFALLCVVALIYLVLHRGLGKWLQKSQGGKQILVKERVALDAKRSLYLVDVEGRRFLLGGSENSVSLIGEFPVERSNEP